MLNTYTLTVNGLGVIPFPKPPKISLHFPTLKTTIQNAVATAFNLDANLLEVAVLTKLDVETDVNAAFLLHSVTFNFDVDVTLDDSDPNRKLNVNGSQLAGFVSTTLAQAIGLTGLEMGIATAQITYKV